MTRKDYRLIAASLAEGYDKIRYPMGYDLRAGYLLAEDRMCEALKADNHLFNEELFLQAATGQIEREKGTKAR